MFRLICTILSTVMPAPIKSGAGSSEHPVITAAPPLDNPSEITALTACEIMLQFVTHVAEYRMGAKTRSERPSNDHRG